MFKKIILLCLLTVSLYASDENTNELFDYSHLCVSDSLSFYAGKVYMQNFQDENAYSVGLLLHQDKSTDTGFGFGYMQPVWQIDSLLLPSLEKAAAREEGILFFMNYHF